MEILNDTYFISGSGNKIKVGDKVYLTDGYDDDDLFSEWEEEQKVFILTVEAICNESELVWLKDCPCALPFSFIELATEENQAS